MPNIYLRLPTSRCQYIRHRDPHHTLARDEPVVFNMYMPEYFVLRNGISSAAARNMKVDTQCFSQQQWRNMMCGKHPLGGDVIVKRNAEDYLTFQEVERLVGIHDYAKSANEDYLCVKLPSEIEVVDTIRPVTPTWNLEMNGIRQLVLLLNNDFKRSVVEWALSTFDYCTSNGRIVLRSQPAMLERYLMRYGIEPTMQEKDNLRRVIERWMRTDQNHFSAYSCLDMKYVDIRERTMHIDGIQWQ